MPETLYIGSDINTAETKVLFDERDFFDLVEYYMGQDAVRHIEAMISADKATQAEHERELKEAYAEGYAEGFKAGYKKHNSWA